MRTFAERNGADLAIEDGEKKVSYAMLIERMNRLANVALNTWKLQSGDVVALVSPNCAEYFEIVLALSEVGITVATLNPRMSGRELQEVLEDCNPRRAIVAPECEDAVLTINQMQFPLTLIDQDYEQLLAEMPLDRISGLLPETENFALCYTSGTTGKPKGVLLSHRSRALTCMSMAIEYGCFGAGDRFLLMVPMCHGAGFAFALASISFGGTCVLFPQQTGEAITERLARGDISGVFMVPTHFSRIASMPKEATTGIKAKHKLKAIISNAAALNQTLKELAVAVFGEGLLHETYGSTEAGIVTNISPVHILEKPSSVGKPFLHTEVEIRKPNGDVCAPGEIGELFSRAPYTFSGYLNRPEATNETIRDGWVSVQDLALKDHHGFISICGRMKDMVVSGGVNIYPAEIESILEELSEVTEAAVIGVPDPEWGERLHAFIVAAPNQTLNEQMVIDACRAKLSAYKIPKGVTQLDELPRNASGKLLKRQLREFFSSQIDA